MSKLLVLTADFHRKTQPLDLTRFGIERLLFWVLTPLVVRIPTSNLHVRGAFLYPVAAHGLQLTNDYYVTLRVVRASVKD